MSHSVADLVALTHLGLRLIVTGTEADRDITWVASSDLRDPTPFLESEQLLLSTGRQFIDVEDFDFVSYVTRLQATGIVGIGFGTEVLRDGVPEGLVEACTAADMTLVEVPFRTPFLALIRWVAAEIERDARRRDEWALEALRRIPAAALAGDVGAALAELANQIGGSVILVDGSGTTAAPRGTIRPTQDSLAAIAEEAGKLLHAGRRGGRDLTIVEGEVSLQTLGPGRQLAGVLVVLTPERLDRAARLVVNAVVALLEVSIFQEERAEVIRRGVADRAVASAIEGLPDVTRALVEAAGGRMPDPPLVVTASRFASPAGQHAARPAFDQSGMIVGTVDGEVVVTIAAGPSWRRRVDRITAAGGRTGVASAASWESVGLAVDRARGAMHRATPESQVVEWERTERRALESALGSADVVAFSTTAIRAVLAEEHGDELLRCARVWLQHDGRWDASANALGMHRHSLKARIRRVGAVLALNIETFEGRVELHLLLTEH